MTLSLSAYCFIIILTDCSCVRVTTPKEKLCNHRIVVPTYFRFQRRILKHPNNRNPRVIGVVSKQPSRRRRRRASVTSRISASTTAAGPGAGRRASGAVRLWVRRFLGMTSAAHNATHPSLANFQTRYRAMPLAFTGFYSLHAA